MKDRAEKVYYINLRDKSIEKQIKLQQLKHLLYGIAEGWENKQEIQYKSVKVIIDDINRLQKFSPKIIQSIFEIITGFADNKNVDVICVSSSSGFVQKLTRQSFIQKTSIFKVIGRLKLQQYTNLATQVMKRLDRNNKVYQSIKKIMIQNQYSLRKIVIKLGIILKQKLSQTQQDQRKYLTDYDLQQKEQVIQITQNILNKLDNKKLAISLISQILKTPKDLSMGNCVNVRKKAKIGHKIPTSYNLNNATEELDQQNIVIFCEPKTNVHKKALQEVKNNLQNQIKGKENSKNQQSNKIELK